MSITTGETGWIKVTPGTLETPEGLNVNNLRHSRGVMKAGYALNPGGVECQ